MKAAANLILLLLFGLTSFYAVLSWLLRRGLRWQKPASILAALVVLNVAGPVVRHGRVVVLVICGVLALLLTVRVTSRARATLAVRRADREVADAAEAQASVLRTRWADVAGRADRAVSAWLAYDHDLTALAAAPAMRDLTDPFTVQAAQWFARVQALAQVEPSLHAAGELDDAVTQFEAALAAAQDSAAALGTARLRPDAAQRVAVARRLLAICVDDTATPAERDAARRRAEQELAGVFPEPV